MLKKRNLTKVKIKGKSKNVTKVKIKSQEKYINFANLAIQEFCDDIELDMNDVNTMVYISLCKNS